MLRACEWHRPCRLSRKGKEAHFHKNDWAEAEKPLTLADSEGEKRKTPLKVLLASH